MAQRIVLGDVLAEHVVELRRVERAAARAAAGACAFLSACVHRPPRAGSSKDVCHDECPLLTPCFCAVLALCVMC